MTDRLDAAPTPATGGRSPAIWLADAIRAATALAPTADVIGQIAVLLGLEVRTRHDAPAAVVEPAADLQPRLDVETPLPTTPVSRPGTIAPSTELTAEEPAVLELERAGTSVTAPMPLPELAAVLPSAPAVDLGPTTLLSPGQQRALLGALCSRPTPGDELDLDELVERRARRDPMRTLPRRPVRTTRRGLQLLVDFGPGMLGFQRDRDEVWQVVSRLAGADGFEVLRFAVTPLDPRGAGPRLVNTWRRYEPPAWGRPVLVLSDLGTGAPAAERGAVTDRWLRFAAKARTAGCPVTALVPASERRIPERLRREIAVVAWDRATTVRHAVAAARQAGRRVQPVEQ